MLSACRADDPAGRTVEFITKVTCMTTENVDFDNSDMMDIDDSVIAEGGIGEGSSNDYDRLWDDLAVAREQETIVSGLVVDAVKGGLVVDLGVRGFIPKSQIATRNLNNLDRYIGQAIEAKVLEVDRDKGRVLLSERKVADEKRQAQRLETLKNIQEGQIIVGTVRRVTNFGAFLDIGGIDGLLHVSDISWERVENPEEVLSINDEIEVKVLKIERDGERISLGLKQLTDDPWTIARREIKIGQLVDVTVLRVEAPGVVVKVMDGVEGFIPLKDLSEKRIESTAGVVEVGQVVTAKVTDMRLRDRRMTLSIRDALRDSERSELRQYMTKQREEISTPTLGDLFGDVLSRIKVDDK